MMQKRLLTTLAAALLLAGASLAGEYGKCAAPTQECLNQMVQGLRSRGWVGLELDTEKGTSQMIVTRVVPGSPAEASGFKVGDRLVSFNGIELKEANEAALQQARTGMNPGKQVTYKVERSSAMRELTVTLATVPDDVVAQWVGRHMLEHARVDVAQN
jgi:S1-C subfamily serine protease